MTSAETIDLAYQQAADMAILAGPEELLAGAADREIGPAVLAELLAHEVAAGHKLMLRLAGAADGMLTWSQEMAEGERAAGEPDTGSVAAERAAARLLAVAGRLMEQVRQGLRALRRLRPELAKDEGVWIALNWLDGRCTEEELERRVIAAKAARAAHEPPPREPEPLSERAAALRVMAREAADALATEAGIPAMAAAAASEGRGGAFLKELFAYQLGACHGLAMRLTGCADRALERAVAAHEDPADALALAAAAARLSDHFRRGLVTLHQIDGRVAGAPRPVAGMVWGGRDDGGYKPGANDAANDAATAGHGVHRSDSEAGATEDRQHQI